MECELLPSCVLFYVSVTTFILGVGKVRQRCKEVGGEKKFVLILNLPKGVSSSLLLSFKQEKKFFTFNFFPPCSADFPADLFNWENLVKKCQITKLKGNCQSIIRKCKMAHRKILLLS